MSFTPLPAPPDAVDETALDDLRARLRAFRPVPGVGDGWRLGMDAGALADLVRYWADDYDWRAAERRIRSLPWRVSSGGLRYLHQQAPADDAPAVVLLHGWPDSVLRFERVLPLLTDAHVVVPALPGYPFSGTPGTSGADMAEPIAAALDELGHASYVVSGGDIGTQVAEAMARRHPDRVSAIHLTDIPFRSLMQLPEGERSEAERDYLRIVDRWRQAEGAYSAEHSTKPDTLSAALGDTPAGLAAWIVEKLRSWSDCGGDVERVFPRDDLLTWVSAYWFTGAIGTSFAPYALRQPPAPGRVEPPLVASIFPHDIWPAPRGAADRTFTVAGWSAEDRGGHFAAWEQPELFVAGVRRAIAVGRDQDSR